MVVSGGIPAQKRMRLSIFVATLRMKTKIVIMDYALSLKKEKKMIKQVRKNYYYSNFKCSRCKSVFKGMDIKEWLYCPCCSKKLKEL